MKYFGAFILTVLISFNSLAQSADKGKLFLDLDGGLAGYSVNSNATHTGSGAGLATMLNFGIGYNVQNSLNLGIEFNSHQFLVDSVRENTSVASALTGMFSFRLQYHLINNEKFNLYVGSKVGWSAFGLVAKNTSGTVGILELGGTVVGLNAGFRKYFGNFGLRMELGFHQIPMVATAFYVDNIERIYYNNWLKVEDFKARFIGGYLTVGISLKLGKGKKKDAAEE
jgi:hypothetical protein